jgi:hypothetical protein
MASPTTPTVTHSPPLAVVSGPREIKLISHSTLFYWWPVWVFGFFFALWTYAEGNRLAIVPGDARLTEGQTLDGGTKQYVMTTKHGPTRPMERALMQSKNDPQNELREPAFAARVTQQAWVGTVFIVILVITISITNVPLRGLWSFLTIMGVVVISLLITLFHGWDELFERVANLRVYINLAGYLFIATAVFILWAAATFVFDRRQYIIFTPGQIKVCEHIGDSVRTYDTVGMTFEKQRDDLFRHYILGFGSGDLIVRTSGAERHEIKLPNVLGIGWNLKRVEEMLREKAIVTG